MPHWFSQAAHAFRPLAPAVPVEFQLECICGRTINGVRTKERQLIVCSSCAHQLFVMPVSVYPTPKSKKKKEAKRAQESKKETGKSNAKPSPAKRPRRAIGSSFLNAWRERWHAMGTR